MSRMKVKGARKPAKPCRRCGCEERYIANGSCPTCKAASEAAWAKANPERYKAITAKANKKAHNKQRYGVSVSQEKTELRRLIEERQERNAAKDYEGIQ